MSKKFNFILLFVFCLNLFGENRYELKSGIVEYEIFGTNLETNEKVKGKSKLIFKDFGSTELVYEKLTHFSNNIQETEITVTKTIDDNLYTVDFEDETIYLQKIYLEDNNKDIKSYSSLTQMNAIHLGKELILNYNCDVWKLGDNKFWIYNSVLLKQISKSLGFTQTQIAKSAKFNIAIKEEELKLPNFKIKNIEKNINSQD